MSGEHEAASTFPLVPHTVGRREAFRGPGWLRDMFFPISGLWLVCLLLTGGAKHSLKLHLLLFRGDRDNARHRVAVPRASALSHAGTWHEQVGGKQTAAHTGGPLPVPGKAGFDLL